MLSTDLLADLVYPVLQTTRLRVLRSMNPLCMLIHAALQLIKLIVHNSADFLRFKQHFRLHSPVPVNAEAGPRYVCPAVSSSYHSCSLCLLATLPITQMTLCPPRYLLRPSIRRNPPPWKLRLCCPTVKQTDLLLAFAPERARPNALARPKVLMTLLPECSRSFSYVMPIQLSSS